MKKLLSALFLMLSVSVYSQTSRITVFDTIGSSNRWLYTWDGTFQVSAVDSSGFISMNNTMLAITIQKTRTVLGDTIVRSEMYYIPFKDAGSKLLPFIQSTQMKAAIKKEIKKTTIKKPLTEGTGFQPMIPVYPVTK